MVKRRKLTEDRYALAFLRGSQLFLIGAGNLLSIARVLWLEALESYGDAKLYERIDYLGGGPAIYEPVSPNEQN